MRVLRRIEHEEALNILKGLLNRYSLCWEDALKIKDVKVRVKKIVKSCLKTGWAPFVVAHGHLIIESDGFDAKHFLNLYFRVIERRKWLRELDELTRKYMLGDNFEKDYMVMLRNKI